LPEGAGKELLTLACMQCHSLQAIVIGRDGLQGWRDRVDEMILRGAQLLPEEAETLSQYLFKNYGPGMKPMQTGLLPPNTVLAQSGEKMDAKAISLPDGNGKDLVKGRCVLCHDLGKVVSLRRSQKEWAGIVKNMIARGIPATPEQVQTITSYLSTQFGKKAE
jgi:mono/diheme cytochrome c family protein